jgi:hypothetical protein
MEHKIDAFFEDAFNMSILGMLLYFGALCWIETKNNKNLTVKKWLQKNALQLALGLLVCLTMVAKDDDIMHELYNSKSVWPWWVYFSGGIILNILYQIVDMIPKIAEYLVKKFNPLK